MGRHPRVPVDAKHGTKLVKRSKIGTDSNTPHYPRDVRYDILERMGFNGMPEFADEGNVGP